MRFVQLTVICVSLIVGTTAIPTFSRGVQLDDQGDDCCQLEWLPLIERGTKRFIPSSAVSKGAENGTKWFYFIRPGETWDDLTKFGIISDEVDKKPIFLEPPIGCWQGRWQGGYVLSNPNKCVTGRTTIENGKPAQETIDRQFPSVDGKYFIGGGVIGYGVKSFSNQHSIWYFDLADGKLFFGRGDMFPLYVDCPASLKNHLTAELFDIEFNVDKLLAPFQNEAVERTEITNESDKGQSADVDLTAKISSALEMIHATELNSVASTKWAIHASSNLNLVKDLISLGVKEDSERQHLQEQFTRNGSIRIDSKRTIYKFKQSIDIQPHTKTKVVINTRPIKGMEKFKAHYRLKSDKPGMSDRQILRTLERIGFADVDKIRTVNGELVLTYDGEISVDAGLDTHVLIKAHSTIDGSRVTAGKILPLEFVPL